MLPLFGTAVYVGATKHVQSSCFFEPMWHDNRIEGITVENLPKGCCVGANSDGLGFGIYVVAMVSCPSCGWRYDFKSKLDTFGKILLRAVRSPAEFSVILCMAYFCCA